MNLKLKFFQQQVLTAIGIVGLLASIFYSFYTETYLILLSSFLYSQFISGLIGNQIVLHRYFSHRSFKVSNFIHNIFLILSFTPGQGSAIAWAAAHRHHHKHSDKELDNHSPRESYFLAAGGWLLKGYHWIVTVKKLKTIPTDLLRDKTLVLLDKHYYNIWWSVIVLGLVINYKFALFFLIAPIGWSLFLSALVTLGCHIKLPGSYRNFETDDNTYNNKFIQCIILGDALHNTHHMHPNLANLKINSNEFDLAGTIIKCISKN
jgi:stearoyl-CoA desaturase (delta-9 desaturase)